MQTAQKRNHNIPLMEIPRIISEVILYRNKFHVSLHAYNGNNVISMI